MPVAQLLINHGANPNAFHMWGGQYKFTALTGAFGEGEQGPVHQPEHPECEAFARLLLDAGANPTDSQALYNRMFTKGRFCLALLLEYGLSKDDKCNWLNDDGSPVSQTVFDYQLWWAVNKGHADRVQLLIDHSADLNVPDAGPSLRDRAVLKGHSEVAEILAGAGAKSVALQGIDAFVKTCAHADGVDAHRMLDETPGLIDDSLRKHADVLHNAVKCNRFDAVALMLELGFPINHLIPSSPLHEAINGGNLDMIRFLIDKGADTTLRDPDYNSTPIGHAHYGGHDAVVNLLINYPLDIVDAIRFNPEQVEGLIEENPALVNITFADLRRKGSNTNDCDWMTPLAFAVDNKQLETIRYLLNHGANRSALTDRGLTIEQWVRDQCGEEITSLFD